MSTPPREMENVALDVAILIALPEEFRTLADDLEPTWTSRRNEKYLGYDYFFTGPNGYRCVATIMGRMGPTESNTFAQRLLEYQPALMVNIGIAGSLKDGDLQIGDVLVPYQVTAYVDTGKMNGPTWEARGTDFKPSGDLVAEILHLPTAHRMAYKQWATEGRDDLAKLLPDPTARQDADKLTREQVLREEPILSTKHLASGPFVIVGKHFADQIRSRNADIFAAEMEAAGMMNAVDSRRDRVSSLIIRGISDHVAVEKAKLDAIGKGALRSLAMRNAWRLLQTLMRLGLLPRVPASSATNVPPPQQGSQPIAIPTETRGLHDNEALPEQVLKELRDERKRLRKLPSDKRGPGTAEYQRLEELNETLAALEKKVEKDIVDEFHRKHVLGDRYSFSKELGEGSSGKVWSCYDNHVEQEVAIKILQQHLHNKVESRERFRREARYMRQLAEKSPYIPKIYATETEDLKAPAMYYAMELVPDSLNIVEAAKRGGLGLAIDLFLQACSAVSAAHKMNICHRDLKPANVLVSWAEKPIVKVCDFSLAKGRDTLQWSSNSKFIGTIGYAAPEQGNGTNERFDPRLDIYSLGMIFYSLLTRQYLTQSARTNDKLAQTLVESILYTTMPRKFADVFLRAVDENPERRYATVEQLTDDIEALMPYVPEEAADQQARLAPVSVSKELLRFDDALPRGLSIVSNIDQSMFEALAHLTLHWTISNMSVAVFDFSGELIDRVLPQVPRSMTNRVLWVNPSDSAHAVGVNPLAYVKDDNRDQLVLALQQILELPMDVALRDPERALLATALRILSHWLGVSVFGLNSLLGNEEYRRRLMKKLKTDDPLTIADFSKHFRTGMSTQAGRLMQAISRLFTNGTFTDVVSQPKPKSALLPLTFAKNKVSLFDFRSDQLTPKMQACLLSLMWLEHELQPPEGVEPCVIVFGAEKMDPFCWKKLGQAATNMRMVFVCNGEVPRDALNGLPNTPYRRVVHHRFANTVVTTQPLPTIASPNSVFILAENETTELDERQLRLVLSEKYIVAEPQKVIELSLERLAIKRQIVKEKQSRFVESSTPDLVKDTSIGQELNQLIQSPFLNSDHLRTIASIAFKMGYFPLGRQFLDRTIRESGLDLDACLLGVRFHANAREYAFAFEYATKGVRAAAQRQPPLSDEDRSLLFQLVRNAIRIVMHEVHGTSGDTKDLAQSKEFLHVLATDFAPLLYPMPSEPPLMVLRAQAISFTDPDKGRADWQTAISVDKTPGSINAYATWIKDIERDLSRAETMYRHGLARFPTSALLMHNLARLLLALQVKNEANGPQYLEEAHALITKALKSPHETQLGQYLRTTLQTIRNLRGVEGESGENAEDGALLNVIEQSPVVVRPTNTKKKPLRRFEGQIQRNAFALLTHAYDALGRPAEITVSSLKLQLDKQDPGFLSSFKVSKFKDFLDASVDPHGPLVNLRDADPTKPGAFLAVFNKASLDATLPPVQQSDEPDAVQKAEVAASGGIAGESNESKKKTEQAASDAAAPVVDDEYKIGKTLTVRITRFMPFGAFVTAGKRSGLIHLSEFPRMDKPLTEMLHVGDELRVKIIGHREGGEKLELSLRQALNGDWSNAVQAFPVGSRHQARVTGVNWSGIFVQLAPTISGLIPRSKLTESERTTEFAVGRTVNVVVVLVNHIRQNLLLELAK